MKNGIEIEIITYNRPQVVEKWLEINFKKIKALNIALALYDSSTNNETEMLVNKYNENHKGDIKYVHLPSTTKIDNKVLAAILESEYSYVWPLGDSRCIDFCAVENKVLPFYKKGYDFMCIWSKTGKNNDEKTYNSAQDFFDECFWHTTWMGGIIFNRAIFSPLDNDDAKKYYMNRYNREDAFNYLGIFYDLIAGKNIQASMSFVDITEMFPNKITGWISRYMDVWCGNLCYLIDTINDYYKPSKEKVLKETWHVLRLDSPLWCYKARKKGGLNKQIFEHYDKLGYIDRVTIHKKKMLAYTTMPYLKLRIVVIADRAKYFVQRVLRKLIRMAGLEGKI